MADFSSVHAGLASLGKLTGALSQGFQGEDADAIQNVLGQTENVLKSSSDISGKIESGDTSAHDFGHHVGQAASTVANVAASTGEGGTEVAKWAGIVSKSSHAVGDTLPGAEHDHKGGEGEHKAHEGAEGGEHKAHERAQGGGGEHKDEGGEPEHKGAEEEHKGAEGGADAGEAPPGDNKDSTERGHEAGEDGAPPPGLTMKKNKGGTEREAALGKELLDEKLNYAEVMQEAMAKEKMGLLKPGADSYVGKAPDGIMEKAHKLMQSGNHGIGTPFGAPPGPKPPKHLNDIDEDMEEPPPKLGIAYSAELVRCFRGQNEVPCGISQTRGEDALTRAPAAAAATMEGVIQLTPGEAIIESERNRKEDKGSTFQTTRSTCEQHQKVNTLDGQDAKSDSGGENVAEIIGREALEQAEIAVNDFDSVQSGGFFKEGGEGIGLETMDDMGGCEFESMGEFESVGEFESMGEFPRDSAEERLEEVDMVGEFPGESEERQGERKEMTEEEMPPQHPKEEETLNRPRIPRGVGIKVQKREPSPPRPAPPERPKCDDPDCNDCQLGPPPALGNPRQGGLKTTLQNPEALERERRDIPPCHPEYAEQYMMYAQQYAAYAQHFAMYAQFCAQQGQPSEEPQPRQLRGPLQTITEEREPPSSCGGSEGKSCCPAPTASAGAPPKKPDAQPQQPKAISGPSGPQRAMVEAQPQKQAVAKAQPKAVPKDGPKPIMITPYRHNWLISGVHEEEGEQGEKEKKTWTQEIQRFTGFDLGKLSAQCRTCFPMA